MTDAVIVTGGSSGLGAAVVDAFLNVAAKFKTTSEAPIAESQ